MTENFSETPKGHWDGPNDHRTGIDTEVRVLLVGPATDLLDDVAEVVREAGCSAQESWHAADALHFMATAFETGEPFHTVIVDEALSGVDAELFAVLTREDDRFTTTPLILLERTTGQDFGRFAAVGYQGRIGPTADPTSLPNMIENLLTKCLTTTPKTQLVVEGTETGAAEVPTILVVEDNAINMEVACEMIQNIGYSSDRAVNGHQALEEVRARSYDLVFMDCQMPGMDGYEVTSRIRTWEENSGGRRIPIVAVTAHAMTGDRERCLAAGMDDYMTKPIELHRLADMIAKWLPSDTTSGRKPEPT